MPPSPQQLAEAYAHFLQRTREQEPFGEIERLSPLRVPEYVVHSVWADAPFPCEGNTVCHGNVRILTPGTWNRGAGPDFLQAEIEFGKQRLCGDIEIDIDPPDWERDGHSNAPAYDGVVLHIVLNAPHAGWYTRTLHHKEVPIFCMPPALVQCIEEYAPPPATREEAGEVCPLRRMSETTLETLLQAAAAYRLENKRVRFRRLAGSCGESQAWYRSWAETLGYRTNKWPMKMLAQRAPLSALGSQAEAFLFGIAGFLTPTLPQKTSEEARAYHRQLWDTWWLLREEWELTTPRKLPWSAEPVRPLNHPQRRIAALAATLAQWDRLLPLLRVSAIPELTRRLSSLSHPYWSRHCTLASAPLSAPAALAGKERVDDFLVNVLYAQDDRPGVWQNYLHRTSPQRGSFLRRKAQQLVGERPSLLTQLRCSYIQQALLQIDRDFSRGDGLYAVSLGSWEAPKGY